MRTTLLFSFLFFTRSFLSFSQCDPIIEQEVIVETCSSNSVLSMVNVQLLECPEASAYSYHWEFLENGETIGTADSNFPAYSGFIIPGSGFYSICVTVSVLDDLGNTLGSSTTCNSILGSEPLSFCQFNVGTVTNCITGACVDIQFCGGSAGYSVFINDQFFNFDQQMTIFPSCGFEEGTYDVSVSDANGCVIEESFTILGYSGTSTSALVYFDANNDGDFNDNFISEPTLSNQAIHLVEPDITVYTDSNGSFTLEDLPAGTYTVEWIDNSDVFDISPAFNSTITVPSCIEIPLVSTDNTMLQVSGPCCIWMMDIHCTNGFNPGLYIENTGSVTINGTFTMTFDESLIPEYLSGAIPYNDYTPGQITWNIVNLIPGEMALYQCHILGPGTDQIGEIFPFNMDLELVNNDDEVIYENGWILEPTVVCAYDPNDKYAEPAGYTEEHLITADQEIEYRIRFQNTGNFPAENIFIEDQIDLSVLDMSTFYPVFGSHNFYTVVEDNGMVKFMFDNIFLPSMDSDEPGSQGYVVFRIKPYATLEPWTQIHNTAQIYFDENPPIITNTYLHTIFECGYPAILPTTDEQCEGLSYSIEPDMTYYEDFNWYVDGEYYDNTPYFVYESDNEENVEVTLEMSNPICTGTNEMELTIHDAPNGILTIDGNILTADADANLWAWYVNGEYVEGPNSQTFTANVSGTYQVVASNEWFCNTTSNIINFTGINESNKTRLVLFPNPITDESVLYLGQGTYNISIYDASGRIVSTHSSIQNQFVLQRSNYESGTYTIRVEGNGKVDNLRMIVE